MSDRYFFYRTLANEPSSRPIHVIKVMGRTLAAAEADQVVQVTRKRILSRFGEQLPEVVIVQGKAGTAGNFVGAPHAIARVRAQLDDDESAWRRIEFETDELMRAASAG